MAISKADVRRIAALARIHISEKEEALFERELSSVLEFIAELEKINTSGVTPMTGGTDRVNSMRSDKTPAEDLEGDAETLRAPFPDRKDDALRVRSVF